MNEVISLAVVAALGGVVWFFLQFGAWFFFIKTMEQTDFIIFQLRVFAAVAAGFVLVINLLRRALGAPLTLVEIIVTPVVAGWFVIVVSLAVMSVRQLKFRRGNKVP